MKKQLKRILSALLATVLTVSTAPLSLAADSNPAFKNGPYLLAPKTDSMVVVWESTAKADATIAFGTDEATLGNPIAVQADATAPEFQGAKMNLYHYKLSGLTPGTRYYYEVKLAGGESCKASFKTLETDPESVNLMSLSDSHIFATRDELDAAVKSNDPAFLIHCGDLVEGTGAQAEQFSFWFKGTTENDFIHSYPVVYSSGNHDQGGDFYNAYVYNIQDAEYGAEVNGDSSFNYGGVHITLMNSAPWGLYQMNSEATGNTADASTIETINKAMAWLKKDLASEAAKNADFRILTMHHPKSDAYTNRYIPAIAEAGKVDLMLAGHTHSYLRTVSDDPAIGAGTVYLTHQDARTNSKKGDFFHITVNRGEGVLTVDNFGRDGAAAASKLANETKIAKDKQVLSFSDISITPSEVLYNDKVTIKATVTNNGKGIAAAAIPVVDNGTTRYLYKFGGEVKILEPGQSATLSGTLDMTTLGQHTLSLAGKTTNVAVKYRTATFSYDNVRIKQGTGEKNDINSNVISLKADVTNIGNEAGMAATEFKIDGKTVAAKSYALQSGEKKTAEFTYTFDKAGEYQVTVGTAAPRTVYIEGSIQGMPIIKDKSGSGNDAYLHGQPELGTDDQGHQTVIFDGLRDYIEIPDNGGYTVTDAMTGMVWADLPSAGTTKGGVSELTEQYTDGKGVVADHNPLMLKGIGLGWGTPYLFRIAVRETGKVTYGVCFYDDNGEFSWNDGSDDKAGIQKDTWVQYTSAFNFATGGDSYQNGYNSAHVDQPPFDAPVKNYEGVPMYIGLGFKNTLLTGRNRGMYHTMLPGAVSQVRFYTTKVSAQENDAVRTNPTAAGASAKDLKIWLDFDSKNIVTTGTHTTEWTSVTAAPTSLSYDAAFAGKASIKATVQTSDDGKTVKEAKEYALQSGADTLDLTALGSAKYVRVLTTFVSDLNSTQSSVPVLNEYVLTAGTVKRWNTLVDWQAGTFANAAGHQSGDVYRDHAADFDDYSGAADTPDSVGFTDIAGHWAKDAIGYVTENGLFNGTSGVTFSPDAGMTRAMFVTVLGRQANASSAAAKSKFTDVAADAYYAGYVAWAAAQGIVTGTDDMHFSPDELVTREQMAAILQRYLDVTGVKLEAGSSQTSFADSSAISSYAADAVGKMQAYGLINGKENNRFDPQGTATRAEVATILQRFAQKIAK